MMGGNQAVGEAGGRVLPVEEGLLDRGLILEREFTRFQQTVQQGLGLSLV